MASEPYFHVFPDLPSEMRLKIWGLILSEPRTLEMSCERNIHPTSNGSRFAKAFGCKNPPPALLHVNREARFEALKIYEASFETEHSPNCTYVAFDRDTIRIFEAILSYFSKADLDRITRMTIDVKDYGYFAHFNMDILKSMPSLRKLELVASEGRPPAWNREENAYVTGLKRDFEEAMTLDPGWDCPRVKIVSQATGQEMAVIEGGASIPGWVNESVIEDTPDIVIV